MKLKFLILFLFSFVFLHAQHNFLRYSLQEGLPQSQVYAITEDANGYLWVGTQGGGLAQFDGLSFQSKLQLPDNYINALAKDDQNRIWIGTNSALLCYAGDSIQTIPWTNWLAQKITTLGIDNQQNLWIGTEKGLFSIDTKSQPFQLKKIARFKNAYIRSFYLNGNDQWVATNRGAWSLNANTKISMSNGLESNDTHIIFRDVVGRLWIGTFDGRIYLYDSENLTLVESLTIPNNGHPQFVEQVGEDIWIGTINNGLATYNINNKSWSNINNKNGLSSKNIKCLYRDSWNNLWVGTSGDGLLKSVGLEFNHYGIQAGLKGDNIYAVYQDSKNRILFSESGYGFSILENGQIQHYGQAQGFKDIKCKAILEDRTGRIWIGTEGKGLAYQDTSGFQFLTEKDGLPSDWINSLALDSLGNIWAGTYGNGIVKIVDKDTLGFQVYPFGKAEGLPDVKIQTITIGPNNHLWFATRNGNVGYYAQDFETKVFNQQNGLPLVGIRTIAFDQNGITWIGTTGKGIYYADCKKTPVQFKRLNTNSPKASNNIYLLTFDQQGRLWAGTETGLDQYSLDHRFQIKEYKHFGKAEGFLGIETCQNAVCQDNENNLWFGTMNGLMKYQNNFKSQTIAPPKINIEDIQLFYKSISETEYQNWLDPSGKFTQGLILPHNKNHLGFRLSATNLARPKQIQYRWQLAGSETDWSPLSPTHTINYANLQPGQYVFKAQACITPDNCSPIITTAFGIQQPYWQTWWFKLAIALGTLLFAFIIYRIRIAAVRKTERAKRKELELQNHLLKVEQKALQLQMNPHFIFNALNSINALVALKDFAQARKQINRFAILMRQILSNSRKELISLEEEKDTLQNYLEMEQFCRPDIFNFNIQISKDLDLEEVEVPPMIIQPFVENAIIHGVSHLKGDGQININFSQQAQILVCEITDNGVGRKKSAELRKSRSPSHQSTAMAVTEERLAALFAERHGESIKISDIVDAEGTANGTKVVLRIPLDL